MKFPVITILMVTLFYGYGNAENCTAKNLQTVENCYARLFLDQLDFSYPYLAPNFVQELKQQTSDSDGVIQRCRQQKSFRNCLKKDNSTGDVVAKCVNVDDFLGLSFTRNVTKWAKQYVASFIELDYICGDGYKIFSYATDCIQQIPQKCIAQLNLTAADEFDCGYHEEYIQCMKETTEHECGDAAGCFAHKDAMITACYQETNCTYCEDLDYTNNFYNKLCDSDKSFVAPLTTTQTSTTTVATATTSGASIIAGRFLIMLFFSFSWIRTLIFHS